VNTSAAATGKPYAYVGVFDGHGGFASAEWLEKNLYPLIEEEWPQDSPDRAVRLLHHPPAFSLSVTTIHRRPVHRSAPGSHALRAKQREGEAAGAQGVHRGGQGPAGACGCDVFRPSVVVHAP
jgi:hypothetical protein